MLEFKKSLTEERVLHRKRFVTDNAFSVITVFRFTDVSEKLPEWHGVLVASFRKRFCRKHRCVEVSHTVLFVLMKTVAMLRE